MLSLYAELISSNFSDGFLYELPKVKENGSTESIEFQSKEEFETYANNVSTSPETVNFPLEFQMTPPRYKAIVKGDDYIITSIWNSAFNGFSSLKSISIPNSVTNIGSNAFNSCTSLASIEIPSSVTSIGSNAFDGCSSLKYIRITGNLNSDYSLPSGTWVRTDTPDMPTDWTTNVVTSITAGDSIGYYHQRSAWQNAG